MLFLLVLAKVAGAAEPTPPRGAPTQAQARELAIVIGDILEIKHLNCIGGIRTVSVVNAHTVDVICGYSNAYRIDLDAPEAFMVTRLDY